MGWYSLVSLISDSRIRFLLAFVVVAVIIAGVLTFIEIALKKKKVKREEKTAQESFIEKLKRFTRLDKSPKEKLDYLDSTAKNYFKENYGTHANMSYSGLLEDFEKNKRNDFIDFCKGMFGAYYSSKEIDNSKVLSLTNEFILSVKKKERSEEIARVPSNIEKISRSLNSFSRKVVGVFVVAAKGLQAFGVKLKKEATKRKINRKVRDAEREKVRELKVRAKQARKAFRKKRKQEKKALRQREIAEMKRILGLAKQKKIEEKKQKRLAKEKKKANEQLQRQKAQEEKKKGMLAEQKKKREIVLKRQREIKLQEARKNIALREEEYKKNKTEEEKAKKKQSRPSILERWKKARLLRQSLRAKRKLEKKRQKELLLGKKIALRKAQEEQKKRENARRAKETEKDRQSKLFQKKKSYEDKKKRKQEKKEAKIRARQERIDLRERRKMEKKVAKQKKKLLKQQIKEEKKFKIIQKKRDAEIRKKLLAGRFEAVGNGNIAPRFGASNLIGKKAEVVHPVGSKGWLKSLKHQSGK